MLSMTQLDGLALKFANVRVFFRLKSISKMYS